MARPKMLVKKTMPERLSVIDQIVMGSGIGDVGGHVYTVRASVTASLQLGWVYLAVFEEAVPVCSPLNRPEQPSRPRQTLAHRSHRRLRRTDFPAFLL